jgi:proto-oncogene tyrosine-protein kinase ROS
LTVAKELNIDATEAYIYWSTGHAVECARLNGKNRRTYYPAELFSGKQGKYSPVTSWSGHKGFKSMN